MTFTSPCPQAIPACVALVAVAFFGAVAGIASFHAASVRLARATPVLVARLHLPVVFAGLLVVPVAEPIAPAVPVPAVHSALMPATLAPAAPVSPASVGLPGIPPSQGKSTSLMLTGTQL